MSKADPKPGRWILPLVLVGIVGFTYVFVNAIPPAPVETTLPGNTPDTTSAPDNGAVTTTAAPDPALVAFLAQVDALEIQATDLMAEANTINDDWDGENATFSGTRSAFQQYEIKVQDFAEAVAAVIPPPTVTTWTTASGAASAMSTAAGNMLDGFLDPDSAAGRRSGLADLEAAAAELASAFTEARTAAGN